MSILLAALLALSSGVSGALPAPPEKKVLENGATVLCRHLPDSRMVTVQVRVLSGLSNEGPYAGTGVSHFLEHLLFKGTEKLDSQAVRSEIKSMGGITNGSTGLDSAEYHITVPEENFEKALSLLVNMVTQPVFSEEDFRKERDVILKELNLHYDDPVSRRIFLLFSEAYREHVYKYPIVGYPNTLGALSPDDILRYHRSVYTPERMIIGVTGGVPPARVFPAAEKAMEGILRGKQWMSFSEKEPRQLVKKRSDFSANVTLGYIAIGFHSSDLYSKDLYAGDVLSVILGEGNDSRLYTRMVKEKELLYAVNSGNYTPKYPGLLVVTGIGDPEITEKAVDGIFEQIEELKDGKIDNDELERAKNMIISDYLGSHESIEVMNSSMTTAYLLTGDAAFFDKYVEGIKEVTSSDVRDAARKYLRADNSTVVTLYPSFMARRREDAVAGPAGEPSEKYLELDNGMRIIVREDDRVPLVSFTLACPGGLRAETKDNNGVSNLTAMMLTKGTRRRGEDEIVPGIERLGGSLEPFSGMNSVGVSMKVLSSNLEESLDIFEDVIKNSEFPENELRKLKKRVKAAIKEQEKDIFSHALNVFRSRLYGEHPYGMKLSGTVDSVSFITREEIRRFYDRHLAPSKAVLTVVGDVNAEDMVSELTGRFSRWKGEAVQLKSEKIEEAGSFSEYAVKMEKEQALAVIGSLGVKLGDDRRYALAVLSSVLSGSDGMLFKSLREEEGLTYASGAFSVPEVDRGYFAIYAATVEENLVKVKNTILGLLKKIRDGEISGEEIDASIEKVVSRYELSLETNSSLSMVMCLDELYGLGYRNYTGYPEEIRKVTKEDVVSVAGELLEKDDLVAVLVRSSGL
ncbi:MAG: hypothetical protein GF408_00555 [Candidatus Omnitrophica bacterium]|nr:hypothetical protein [Candidatus Omnitrophota bacterium]